MEQRSDRMYPSVPLENIDSELRVEEKLNDVNLINNSVNNIIVKR